jgi:hypothetical protein
MRRSSGAARRARRCRSAPRPTCSRARVCVCVCVCVHCAARFKVIEETNLRVNQAVHEYLDSLRKSLDAAKDLVAALSAASKLGGRDDPTVGASARVAAAPHSLSVVRAVVVAHAERPRGVRVRRRVARPVRTVDGVRHRVQGRHLVVR